MSSLSDLIERYLREQLTKAETIEIQRRELARMFRCVPSQINYVLETRFTVQHGYLVYSRRGGGGFIRITKVDWKPSRDFPRILKEKIGSRLSSGEMEIILYRLVQAELLDQKAAVLVQGVIQEELAGLPEEEADILRASFLRVALLILCQQE